MLTATDIKKELDIAGVGPVIEINKLFSLIGASKSMIYKLLSENRLVRASGRGVVTRDSVEKMLRDRQDLFCRLYDQNRQNRKENKRYE